MRSFPPQNSLKLRAAIALAAAATVGGYRHVAEATTYVISTSGATALGSFIRGNNNSDNPSAGAYQRGAYTVGVSTLQIGSTVYPVGTAGATYFGTANPNQTISGEPGTGQDQVIYYYRETGSVFGLYDLITSNGLQVANAGVNLYPNDPNPVLFLWENGTRFTGPNQTGVGPGSPGPGRTIGSNNGSVTSNGQPLVHVAWSDVRFEQAYAIGGGTAAYTARPMTAGYGLGRGSVGSTNFQKLADASSIVGGIDPTTTHLRNETVAVEAFNLVANPGTGLGQVTKSDGAWLQMTGRFQNGANFNSVTREIGSGTRNEGDLNLGVDPSWGSGERDRIATAQYSTVDYNGNPVTVHLGDEASPLTTLSGSPTLDPNENRVGPRVRFADKVSGGSGVRATVVASRMAVGILGGGDSSSGTAGNALTGNSSQVGAANNTTSVPLRALAIDWGNGQGYTQATVQNIASGKYQMWSNGKAITVAPYANPTLNDQTFTTRPIIGDQRDVSGGTITTATTSFAANGDAVDPGLHRKFLDNIINSVATANPSSLQITPADFIMNGGYILPQVMSVTKNFDGDTSYGSRTLSGSDQSLFGSYAANVGGTMFDKTNWADPNKTNGDLSGSQSYKIFASANNAVNGATPNRQITLNSRTVLAGDFNGDGVRDLADVPALAYAYANPDAYLTTPASGDPNGRNYNGTAVNSTSSGTNAAPRDGLIVLSDFNANGNVTTDANNGSFATAPIERSDVKWFLYGASVDTSAYNVGTTTTLNGSQDSLTAVENRRENGVRLGQLRKNAAIDTFNATLNGYVGTITNPATGLPYTQGQVDALKFDKFDVNGDGVANRLDAQIVDRNVGKNYANLNDVLSTNDDLVAAELDDNNAITHILSGGTSDFKLIRDALGPSKLLDGDANFDGTVDTVDFNALAANFGLTGRKWSQADFNFDGVVDTVDFNSLAADFGQTVPADGGGAGVVVPEPTSGLLLAIGIGAVVSRRRLRRSDRITEIRP